MALDKVTDEDIIIIQNKLNNRPRKLLDYKTPNEVYDAMRLAV
jgi:IS30 family transposase